MTLVPAARPLSVARPNSRSARDSACSANTCLKASSRRPLQFADLASSRQDFSLYKGVRLHHIARLPADLETASTNAPSAQATLGNRLRHTEQGLRRKLPRADLTVACPTNAGLGQRKSRGVQPSFCTLWGSPDGLRPFAP